MTDQRLHVSAEQAKRYRCTEIFALDVLTGRWRLPIIWTLAQHESLRYNDLKRRVAGVTNIMLTRALRSLEAYNLVERHERRQVPPHVAYSLTPKCREILPALEIIHAWGNDLLNTYGTAMEKA